ncbi:GNAT family N-acetyltransferase [Georgenia sp. M64]|uniref:GNAT family N-acetyltransferase n=1 Tax=Georgenia sp. M64 TaxID=3120520 RepID=UPI0030E3F6C2
MSTPGVPGPHDDVLAGLRDPHAGHGHDDPLRPTSDVSVRPAIPEDAAALGDVHARTLRATLAAGTGAGLPADVAGAVDPGALAAAWSAAIVSPPTRAHRVLTALAGGQVVGFAAFAPATDPVEVAPAQDAEGVADHATAAGTDAPAGTDAAAGTDVPAATDAADDAPAVAEILALEVPAAHARRGHGSRLLAACADLLRDQGTARVQVWAVEGDESRARFLAEAGFAPAGLRRRLQVGAAEVVETCWYADL